MRKILKFLLIILSLLLAAELAFVGWMLYRDISPRDREDALRQTTAAPETTVPDTEPPTTVPTENYILTFTGDFTPGCMPGQFENPKAYVGTVGDDYEFPFRYMRPFFEADDFTFLNLEVVLGLDVGRQANKTFVFSAPEEYVQILTTSSVEAVTLANNHTEDFGQEGYENTRRILEENGISYVEEDKTALFTTESGLTIGLYADSFYLDESEIAENIAALRDQGAQLVICAFHWGDEGSYRHNKKQEGYAHAAIDAGADIVVGHHPHVLQEMECYNGGLIFYSLGNFSFGGNDHPKDYDSAVVQQTVMRKSDGTIALAETVIVPICISSASDRNNYQPVPYEPESEAYSRVLEKLNGTYSGPNVIPGYDYLRD